MSQLFSDFSTSKEANLLPLLTFGGIFFSVARRLLGPFRLKSRFYIVDDGLSPAMISVGVALASDPPGFEEWTWLDMETGRLLEMERHPHIKIASPSRILNCFAMTLALVNGRDGAPSQPLFLSQTILALFPTIGVNKWPEKKFLLMPSSTIVDLLLQYYGKEFWPIFFHLQSCLKGFPEKWEEIKAEMMKKKDLVWDFLNPHRTSEPMAWASSLDAFEIGEACLILDNPGSEMCGIGIVCGKYSKCGILDHPKADHYHLVSQYGLPDGTLAASERYARPELLKKLESQLFSDSQFFEMMNTMELLGLFFAGRSLEVPMYLPNGVILGEMSQVL
ncbi:hypothetical protein T439DRAFT_382048 [Meredithblackwellia eburnea MCA 4105]